MAELVILRHGQSQWNLEGRFTGLVDVELTDKGREEARRAGAALKETAFDLAHSSLLLRAVQTLEIVLTEIGRPDLPTARSASLNERQYGDLTGMRKDAAREKYGAEQVRSWRRDFRAAPPGGESLETTLGRVGAYFDAHVAPQLAAGKNILLAAHGNTLRALVMRLEAIAPEDIPQFELPTARPRRYVFGANLELIDAAFVELPDG